MLFSQLMCSSSSRKSTRNCSPAAVAAAMKTLPNNMQLAAGFYGLCDANPPQRTFLACKQFQSRISEPWGTVQAIDCIHRGGVRHTHTQTHTQTKSRSAITCKTLQTVSTMQRLQFYFFFILLLFCCRLPIVCVCIPHVLTAGWAQLKLKS